MSGKPKPAPIAKAIADLGSVIDAASAEAKRAHEIHAARVSESIRIGDLQSMKAAMDEYHAAFDAAMASGKGSPTAKRASAAGKKSGEARKLQGEGAKVSARYDQLIADGRTHLKARSSVIVEFDHRSVAQIDRDIKPFKK